MVRIKDLSESEPETTEDEITEEEDDEEKPPDPPDPPDPPLAPVMFSAPEPSTLDTGSLSAQPRSSGSGPGLYPSLSVGLSRHYLWYLLRQYGHSVEFNRSLQAHGLVISEELSQWPAELQQVAGPPNRDSDPQFACSFSDPDTADRNMEDNRNTAGTSSMFEYTNSIFTAERFAQTTEQLEKDEGNKTESDESTKEKSNGVGEKVELATTTAGGIAGILSSPELSEFELSDVSDSLSPPDYETLQATDIKQQYSPSESKDCSCAKDMTQKVGTGDDPQLTESVKGKEPLDEGSDEGEAVALPASNVKKDCWGDWIDDDRLFNLASEAPAPSTSSAVSPVSPCQSPTTERRRIKLENRQNARQRAESPVTRYIFVPTEKIGRIVGKGGRRVREIERSSGAKVKVEHKKSANPVTQITLSGTLKEISKADEEICVIIRNFKPPKLGESNTASVSSIEEMELKQLLLRIKNQVLDGEKRCHR